ncbi:hypothetical protein MMPV_004826 [Pyropia vietnamensis]
MAWGAAGSSVHLSGASGREWSLTFGRALGTSRGAVSVHVVDAVPTSGAGGGDPPQQLVAKRVSVPAVDDVEPLVDEAATWRKASVASPLVLELVDVFVDRNPDAPSITFLSQLATPHKASKSKKAAAAAPPALPATAVAAVCRDVTAALLNMPGGEAHGNVAVDTVFLAGDGGKSATAAGAILGGFGPKRVAILAANPELSEADDVYDVGVLLGALAMGRAPKVVAAAIAGGELPEDLSPELAAALVAAVGPPSGRPSMLQLRDAAGGGGALGGATGGKREAKREAKRAAAAAAAAAASAGHGNGGGGGSGGNAGNSGNNGESPALSALMDKLRSGAPTAAADTHTARTSLFAPNTPLPPPLAGHPADGDDGMDPFGMPSRRRSSRPLDGLDAAVTRLTDGNVRAGGTDPRAYATVLSSVRDGGRGEDVFTALFRRPLSKDPVAALQSLTLVHRLLLEAGDDSLLGLVRHNDAFLAWASDSWSREMVEGVADPDAAHPLAYLFAGGEIADYSAFLRRKARFHMLAAFSFTGGWAVTLSGETSLTGRRRKVLTGVADLADSMVDLSARLVAIGGEPREVARAAAATLAVEATGSLAAAVALVSGVDDPVTRGKMVDPFDRCYAGTREVLSVAAAGAPLLPAAVRGLSLDASPPDVTLAEVDTAAERAAAKEARRAARAAAKEQERMARAAEKEAAKAAKAAAKAGIKAAAAAAAAAEAEAKIDRSVGDLVGIGEERAPEAPPAPDRPAPGMSDIHALATAFGASPATLEAIANQGKYLALPAPPGQEGGDRGEYDDEDGELDYPGAGGGGGGGGYQGGGRPRNADGRGYLGLRAKAPASTALVVAGGQSMSGLRPHPAFCHCAVCEAADALAAQAALAGGGGGGRRSGSESDGSDHQDRRRRGGGRRRHDRSSSEEASDSDSDDSAADYRERRRAGRRDRRRRSWDSVEEEEADHRGRSGYSSPEDDHRRRLDEPYNGGLPLQGPADATGHDRAGRAGDRDGHGGGVGGGRRKNNKDAKAHKAAPIVEVVVRRLRTGEKLGAGAFGEVFKGTYQDEPVAIKRLSATLANNPAAVEAFRAEVGVLFSLRHPHVLKVVAARTTPPDPMVLTEFMSRGTLFDVLHKARVAPTWPVVKRILSHVAAGMAYLHSQSLVHRDLKSANVLLDASFTAKVSDFGLTTAVATAAGESAAGGLCGTLQYLAPEVLAAVAPHTPASDVYAYGVLMWELIARTPPYLGEDPHVVAGRVVDEGYRPPPAPNCLQLYRDLMVRCWAQAAAARPTFAEVVTVLAKAPG